jgi:hypothetical protein
MPCWPKSGGLANAISIEGSVVVRWAIPQTSATQTWGGGGGGGGGGPPPPPPHAGLIPAPMEAGLENSQLVRWIETRLRAISPPYAVTGSRCTIISLSVEAKATEHALL